MGELNNIGVPVKLSATPASIRHRGPALGEHTRAILGEHGYTEAEIDALVDGGVVGVGCSRSPSFYTSHAFMVPNDSGSLKTPPRRSVGHLQELAHQGRVGDYQAG